MNFDCLGVKGLISRGSDTGKVSALLPGPFESTFGTIYLSLNLFDRDFLLHLAAQL